jgi:hypothetical protein
MDISSLIPIVKGRANQSLVDSISNVNSPLLTHQRDDFPEALGGEGESKVVCFYETKKSPTAKQVCDVNPPWVHPTNIYRSEASGGWKENLQS